MKDLELLAPAKNIDIGIAAIDCGADAVYIAGPAFGARQAAGNSLEDLARLCSYAHRFGARIFMTLNTILYDNELQEAYGLMCRAEDIGIDAIIVQDLSVLSLANGGTYGKGRKIKIPLHASTQCAIRNIEDAVFYRNLGFSRIVLERELPLETVREICRAADCEVEFFVHGALCVCYSGQCYISEYIAGRSANRGECIQACRSLYNLIDKDGNVIVRNKALLSLKDYNLLHRVGDLAEAGVSSFKIEGRLKNISYVRNTVKAYSDAIDSLIREYPDKYRRASYGKVSAGFTPDLNKTFNRGYTELFLDGKRGKWASMDTPKGMGEVIGIVKSIKPGFHKDMEIKVSLKKAPDGKEPVLCNGDGFAFTGKNSEITGFRGDYCSGNVIRCKDVPGIRAGMTLYRNLSVAFEKSLSSGQCQRTVSVDVSIRIRKKENTDFVLDIKATSEDGRTVEKSIPAGDTIAENTERIISVISGQIGKRCDEYKFNVSSIDCSGSNGTAPFVSAAFLNSLRREIASDLSSSPAIPRKLLHLEPLKENMVPHSELTYKYNISNSLSKNLYLALGATHADSAYELSHENGIELMRTKYCIRYELGLCPRFQKAKESGPLFLENNGKLFSLIFDCRKCEMTVNEGKEK